MDERLIKQWQVTESLLDAAAAEIASTEPHCEYKGFLDHNELELALNVLEDAGHELKVSREYWWNLMRAAEVMGLTERYDALREEFRKATNAAQQVAPADHPKALPSGGH